ncbi:9688_t:CDS:2 [Entrophospora sp. SA101]|nr:9688_t:CDS:2 [Entrophospora sp. SA101]
MAAFEILKPDNSDIFQKGKPLSIYKYWRSTSEISMPIHPKGGSFIYCYSMDKGLPFGNCPVRWCLKLGLMQLNQMLAI